MNLREEFPIFSAYPELAYLDSAATAQKPTRVIERMSEFLKHEYANVLRGAYGLSGTATEKYELVRHSVLKFVGATSPNEIVFTRGTTESINLVANGINGMLKDDDVILLSLLEHHSNIVPWQLLAERKKIKIEFAPITKSGEIDFKEMQQQIRKLKPRLVSVTALSNVFGSFGPIDEIVSEARQCGSLVLVDAAQAVSHQEINVQKLGIDFLAFSGHKMYGPTGVGVLWMKEALAHKLSPLQGGGGMISEVRKTGSNWAEPPQKFEAGTPPIAEVIGLGEAIEFILSVGWDKIHLHEERLFNFAWDSLSKMSGVTLYGPKTVGSRQSSMISFNIDGVHPHDVATVMDSCNVAIRAGHHCAMPAMEELGLVGTCRASFALYNNERDIEKLLAGVQKTIDLFAVD